MQIRFNDTERLYEITAIRQAGNLIILKGADLPEENTSGFKLIRNGREAGDYSDYTVKYNVLTPLSGVLMLTKEDEPTETADSPADRLVCVPDDKDIQEIADPLSNDELTEAVADLMFEVSMGQLGM